MDALQRSETMIAKILSLLMEWGIQEAQLDFSELELPDEYRPFFFPCVKWLADEGVIRYDEIVRYQDNIAAGMVLRPVLTSYGLSVLGQKLKIADAETQLSDAIENVSAGHANYAKVGNFTGGLLASFIKSIG